MCRYSPVPSIIQGNPIVWKTSTGKRNGSQKTMPENETSNGGRVILRPVLTDRCESPTDAVGAA